jgi:hypothetical protein
LPLRWDAVLPNPLKCCQHVGSRDLWDCHRQLRCSRTRLSVFIGLVRPTT